jgi:hypothetical protein
LPQFNNRSGQTETAEVTTALEEMQLSGDPGSTKGIVHQHRVRGGNDIVVLGGQKKDRRSLRVDATFARITLHLHTAWVLAQRCVAGAGERMGRQHRDDRIEKALKVGPGALRVVGANRFVDLLCVAGWDRRRNERRARE